MACVRKLCRKRWRKPERAIIHALPDAYNKRHVEIDFNVGKYTNSDICTKPMTYDA